MFNQFSLRCMNWVFHFLLGLLSFFLDRLLKRTKEDIEMLVILQTNNTNVITHHGVPSTMSNIKYHLPLHNFVKTLQIRNYLLVGLPPTPSTPIINELISRECSPMILSWYILLPISHICCKSALKRFYGNSRRLLKPLGVAKAQICITMSWFWREPAYSLTI